MTIRQLDTWVLDVYADELGWDGQHELIYFRTKRDAEAAGKAMGDRFKRRVAAHKGDQSISWDVYKIGPIESFNGDLDAAAAIGRGLADQFLEAEW